MSYKKRKTKLSYKKRKTKFPSENLKRKLFHEVQTVLIRQNYLMKNLMQNCLIFNFIIFVNQESVVCGIPW